MSQSIGMTPAVACPGTRAALGMALLLWFLPALPAGEPDRDLLKFCRTDEGLPYALFQLYSDFVAALATGDPAKIQPFCTPGTVAVSTTPRPVDQKGQGDDINTPFAKDGFSKFITAIVRESDDRYVVRTATTVMGFTKGADGLWKLSRYQDKREE